MKSLFRLMQMVLFFLLGLLAFPSQLPHIAPRALLIALFLTFVARPAVVALLLTPFRAPLRQQLLVSWSGLRGAASIVFAIMATMHPAVMQNDVFHIVFFIVLFSVLLQGTCLPRVAARLGMTDDGADVMKTFTDYVDEVPVQFIRFSLPEGHPWAGQAVRQVVLPPEMQKKYIDIAYVKAKRLEKLIEDLFGFTKMNYGRISMNVGKVDIVKLLGQLLEEFYPSFMDKDLTYELKSNVPSQVITADGNLLARLFDNLINNAIKYGAEGKKVLVQVLAKDDIVTVSVTNYGYVIPAEELPLIFNKFYRVEQSRSSKTGGTGLGLAIAKSIVDMHGGTISVASDLNGTVFTVKLKVDFDVNKENFAGNASR